MTSLSGPIKTQFTWNSGSNNVAAPTQVIVTQTSTVDYGDSYYIPADGKCDNGFGDPVVNYQNKNQFYTCAGTHISVLPPDASGNITLSCTPTASCSIGDYCHVKYRAFASVVTLNLTGPLTDGNGKQILDSSGNPQIMVGQGCTASLSGGIPSGCTVSYQWSVSGNTLQSWTVSNDQTSATLVSGFGPATNPTAHWFWSDVPGPQTVTCKATITPLAGQGAPFSVTASQTVTVARPQSTLNTLVGRVQINNLNQSLYGAGYALYVGGVGSFANGITYKTTVTTPAPFNVYNSGGLWNLVQIVTPNSWHTPLGSSEQADPNNGRSGLDTYYPLYPGPHSATNPGGVPANGYQVATDPFDGPGFGGLTSANPININYRVSEIFQTHLMYLPPTSNGDVCWVPLETISWYWSANDTIPLSHRPLTWANWNNSVDAGIIRVTGINDQITNPTWIQLIHG